MILLMNTTLDLRLAEAGVPNELYVKECGNHENHYSDLYLARWLPKLMGILADPPPPPAAFDYRVADPTFEVWDWSFTAHRPAVEFLHLRDVSSTGLTATGSGLVDVITPPVYEPGSAYSLGADSSAILSVPLGAAADLGPVGPRATQSSTVEAGPDGRLRFTIDLGPAHTANQFSPEGILAEVAALGSYFRTATVTIEPASTSEPETAPPTSAPPAVDHAGPAEPPVAGTGAGRLPATGGGGLLGLPAAVILAALVLLRASQGRGGRSRP